MSSRVALIKEAKAAGHPEAHPVRITISGSIFGLGVALVISEFTRLNGCSALPCQVIA